MQLSFCKSDSPPSAVSVAMHLEPLEPLPPQADRSPRLLLAALRCLHRFGCWRETWVEKSGRNHTVAFLMGHCSWVETVETFKSSLISHLPLTTLLPPHTPLPVASTTSRRGMIPGLAGIGHVGHVWQLTWFTAAQVDLGISYIGYSEGTGRLRSCNHNPLGSKARYATSVP